MTTLNRYRNPNGTFRYVWDNGTVEIAQSKRRYDVYQTYELPEQFVGAGRAVTMGKTKASHWREHWTGSHPIEGDE
jgi:hypothetical protein